VAEVCRLADVQPHVLALGERVLVLAAPKGATGPRVYSGLELQIIERTKKLYDEATIAEPGLSRAKEEVAAARPSPSRSS
jgi:hypothetical protein